LANYIDQEILCEAYTHFEIDDFPSKTELDRIKRDLIAFFDERAKFLFGEDVHVEVEFEEGSLKTRLKVLGQSALLATALVSNYGSIRQGIDTVAKDSTMLAQSGVLEIAFRTKTAFCDSVAVEKRKGVYGRASAFMSELDQIREEFSRTAIPEKPAESKLFEKRVGDLIAWDLRVDELFAKLQNNATKACIAAGLLEELERMPDQAAWAAQLAGHSFRAQGIRSDAQLSSRLGSAAAGMEKAVAVIKKKMLNRVNQLAPQNT
jgi:hypothetical protein